MPRCCSDPQNQLKTVMLEDGCGHNYVCAVCGTGFIKTYNLEKMKQLGMLDGDDKPIRKDRRVFGKHHCGMDAKRKCGGC